jgi:uncharacterized membrane protein YgaE (UPF0421/DUF939 family)
MKILNAFIIVRKEIIDMKLGARILKTGIALILSLLIAQSLDLPSPVFAGIAAIFAVQPTIYRSYLSIIEQIQGNILGALLAVISVLLFGNNVFIIGLAAIILIALHLKLKLESAVGLSLVTLIAIMETPGDVFIQFAFIRFSTIMLGVLSAFIVNLVFLPPKYENKLYLKISNSTTEITKWIRLTIRGASEHALLKNDIEILKDSLIKIDQLYIMFKEERNVFKRNDVVKSRKLVIYRQMIATVRRALATLKRLHRYENDMVNLPDHLQNTIQQQLDILTHHHEHVMLKFIGKVKPNVIFEEGDIGLNRKELFDLCLSSHSQLTDEEQVAQYHLLQVISAIIEYDEDIDHLDLLITSFQSHHKEDSDITLPENS